MATTTDALIMAGTGMPVVDQAWVDIAMNHYIAPTVGGAFTATPVVTPSQFYPFTGPTDLTLNLSVAEGLSIIDGHIKAAGAKPETDPTTPIVVFGYSQSAVIATFEKRQLATRAAQGESVAAVEFILAANPNRPNGGLSARFPGLTAFKGWTFSEATPTDTPFHTVDIAKQYDFFADFPRYPANLLADLNVLIGLVYGTHNYATATLDPTAPGYHPDTVVQQLGDTTYYFIPADTLPLLLPLHDLGVDPRVLDAIEPVLRVLVEAGYDRTTAYGEPAPAELFPPIDVSTLKQQLRAAVEEGAAIWNAEAPVPAAPTTARVRTKQHPSPHRPNPTAAAVRPDTLRAKGSRTIRGGTPPPSQRVIPRRHGNLQNSGTRH